ncbi:MAG: peptidoglycan DD-metalloendopeptidase family protein, partial [Actinobacteria bacterium]|nr:peptidoglycan DD-metalloendopeptidase family protein [Actinomycetota bacterium]
MSVGHGSRISRIGIAAALLVAAALTFSGSAAGQESLSDLKARMESIQGELDATTIKIEKLRDETDHLTAEIAAIEHRKAELEEDRAELMDDAIARANELYRSGSVETLEILFSAEDFGQLADRAELLSQVSMEDAGVFIKLSRTEAELKVLNEDLLAREKELQRNADLLAAENESLQAKFQEVASEYQRLRRKLAQAQAAPTAVADTSGGGGSAPNVKVKITGDMTCPVAGPHSFVDSWGAPRSGHTHQGVDMMADYGTPLVAITSGTATYVAFDGSGGNMIFLDGDDGNSYWYMHNQENFVREGQHVKTGESIGTVGDTGNASGTPHLHFEFHPGG